MRDLDRRAKVALSARAAWRRFGAACDGQGVTSLTTAGCRRPHAEWLDRSDQLAAFPAEVGAFGGVLGGGDRGVVGLLRLGAAAEPAEQVGAGGVPCVVPREGQPVDQGEGDFRAV